MRDRRTKALWAEVFLDGMISISDQQTAASSYITTTRCPISIHLKLVSVPLRLLEWKSTYIRITVALLSCHHRNEFLWCFITKEGRRIFMHTQVFKFRVTSFLLLLHPFKHHMAILLLQTFPSSFTVLIKPKKTASLGEKQLGHLAFFFCGRFCRKSRIWELVSATVAVFQ